MQDMDNLTPELISLETQLTIYELMLLLRLGTQLQEVDVCSPIAITVMKYQGAGLVASALLEEDLLLQMAQQQRLIRLGLMYLNEDMTLSLTEKGAKAAEWWVGCLQDIREGISF